MKILIVEDDKGISDFIIPELEHEGYATCLAVTGRQALEKFESEKPDLILLDIMLPELNGLEVLRRIRAESTVPVILETARGETIDKINGLNLGADDYIPKPFEIEELLVRVRALLKRTNQIPKSASVRDLQSIGEITLLPEQYSVRIGDKQTKLTPIEFDIFNLLFQNHGNMVSSAKLLKDIWGYSPDDDIETIRVHIRHLRSKIDKISDGKKYIETIYGGGYKLNI